MIFLIVAALVTCLAGLLNSITIRNREFNRATFILLLVLYTAMAAFQLYRLLSILRGVAL